MFSRVLFLVHALPHGSQEIPVLISTRNVVIILRIDIAQARRTKTLSPTNLCY
jgi:hypothetical protein